MSNHKLTAQYSVQMGFSFDTTLGDNLSYLRNAVMNQDFDAAVIVDGKEGSGKSVFGMQVAAFLDRDHHLDLEKQVCFTPKKFKDAVGSLPKGKAIVWDEARRGLNRRRFGSEVNLSITDMLAECRQHNLFLVIIMPSFYDMDLNVAVHRTRALIHVYYEWDTENKERPLKRGFFRFYNEEGKTLLYTDKMLRQRYQYPHLPGKSFDSKFVGQYVVDEERYRQLKKVAEMDYRKQEKNAAPEGMNLKQLLAADRGKMLRGLKRNMCLRNNWKEAAAAIFQVSTGTVQNWMEAAQLNEGEGGKKKSNGCESTDIEERNIETPLEVD